MNNANRMDHFVSCKGETRECLLTYDFDSDIDVLVEEWHKACDNYVSPSITTPILTSLSTVLDRDDCIPIADVCYQRYNGAKSCLSAQTTDSAQKLSCLYQSTQLDLASRCHIDGTSCIPMAVVLTNILEYKYCRPTEWLVRDSEFSVQYISLAL